MIIKAVKNGISAARINLVDHAEIELTTELSRTIEITSIIANDPRPRLFALGAEKVVNERETPCSVELIYNAPTLRAAFQGCAVEITCGIAQDLGKRRGTVLRSSGYAKKVV